MDESELKRRAKAAKVRATLGTIDSLYCDVVFQASNLARVRGGVSAEVEGVYQAGLQEAIEELGLEISKAVKMTEGDG